MPIIMLIIPAGATHRPYRGGGGVTPSLGLLAAQYAAQARGEAGVIIHRAVFQIVRLPSKTPRECGHSGTAAQCQSVIITTSRAILECQVVALHVSDFAETLPECFNKVRRDLKTTEDSNNWHGGLLRSPSSARTADERDELSPSHELPSDEAII